MHIYELTNRSRMVTIGTCSSVYKAEMQKVVYFTESTIAVIAKQYISFLRNKLSAGEYEIRYKIRMSGKCL